MSKGLLLTCFPASSSCPVGFAGAGTEDHRVHGANHAGVKDQDGDFSDWIEIYNPGNKPVSIGGWYLTNSEKDLTQWQFPTSSSADRVPAGLCLREEPHGSRAGAAHELQAGSRWRVPGSRRARWNDDRHGVLSEYPAGRRCLVWGHDEVATTQLVSSDAVVRMWLRGRRARHGLDDPALTTRIGRGHPGIGYDRTPAPVLPRKMSPGGRRHRAYVVQLATNEEVDKPSITIRRRSI